MRRRSFLKWLGAFAAVAAVDPVAIVASTAAPAAAVVAYKPAYKNFRQWRDAVEAKAVARDLREHGPRPRVSIA